MIWSINISFSNSHCSHKQFSSMSQHCKSSIQWVYVTLFFLFDPSLWMWKIWKIWENSYIIEIFEKDAIVLVDRSSLHLFKIWSKNGSSTFDLSYLVSYLFRFLEPLKMASKQLIVTIQAEKELYFKKYVETKICLV
jgi:hypothetical protein